MSARWLCALRLWVGMTASACVCPLLAQTASVVFVGDVMLADLPGKRIQQGHNPFAPFAAVLNASDIRIANLECVIATIGKPEDKPFTFRAHPRVIPVLQRHFDAVTLANNHSGDFGPEAFAEMLNLLQNAREALGDNGKVVVAAACHHDMSVEISVRDDGPGIPPEKIERVFEAYYTTKEKGTGLGLAIVKHNAELYGGSVRVESVLGKGAKFTVIFPAKALMKFSK